MRTAWVLSGGGAKGSIQFGIAKALMAKGFVPETIFGISAGSLNTALLSRSVEEGERVWRAIRSERDIFKFNPATLLIKSRGIKDSKPLRKKLEKVYQNPAQIPYEVGVWNVTTHAMEYISHNAPDIIDFNLASASIPVYVDPVEINGFEYGDGGVKDNVPLKQAIAQGFDRIFVLLCDPVPVIGDDGYRVHNFVDYAFRSFDEMRREILLNDLQTCFEKNEIAKRDYNSQYRVIDLHVIAPKVETIGGLDFDKESIARGLKEGEKLGEEWLRTRDIHIYPGRPAEIRL
jgi:NTE family protein